MNNISIVTTNSIKGITAIFVVLHHISQNISDPDFLYVFQWVGTISVGLFFFFSGYGLTYQLYNKKNYLNTFFEKRLFKILVPFFLSNIIYILYNVVFNGIYYSFNDILKYIIGIELINPISWYVVAILWLYIGFYTSFKYIKRKTIQLFALSVFIFCYIGWCVLNHQANFVSIFCFPLGIIYVQLIDKLKIIHRNIIVCILSILFIYLFYEVSQMQYINNLINVLYSIIECLCFSIIVILLCSKYEIKNRILNFLGSISFETYLIHGLALNYLIKNSEFLSVSLIIPLSVFSAFIFRILHQWIEAKISSIFIKHNV